MNQKNPKIDLILWELKKAVVGKDEVIQKVLMAVLAGGHILVEDIPGVGKTTMALAFSKALQLDYKRVQFTPDVLPSDVVGFSLYTRDGGSQYMPGSILCNLFLADEINRTSSKTQSALLEVMEEGSVTVDGRTHAVPKPFTVIATQNPAGSVGTQMLPESQMDRFMVRLSMGYPDIRGEVEILKNHYGGSPLKEVGQAVSREELLLMKQETEEVFIHDVVYEYIARLAQKTREHELLALGLSPRGTIALAGMARAAAYLAGRNYVIPDDVRKIFPDTVMHRMVLSPKARANKVTLGEITAGVLSAVNAPRLYRA